MSTVTPNMNLTIPVDHSPADNDVWGVLISTALGTGIDQHDHSTGKGVKVPVATGINFNADFSVASHVLKDALAYDMTPVLPSAVSSLRSAIYTSSSDSNLYFINPGGTPVQITAGNTINIAIAGAIGGDYGSVGALLSFIDASDTYIFQQQVGSAVRQYGKVAHADLDLYEYKAQSAAGVPVNRVRLKSPAALAASYDLTWLTALPASTSVVQVSSTGQFTADQANAVVTTNTLTASDLKHSGTWRASVPLAGSNTSSGIGAITAVSATASGNAWSLVTGQIPVIVGDTLTEINAGITGVSGQTYTFDLIKVNTSAGLVVMETWTDVMTGAYHTTTRTLVTPRVIAAAEHWHIRCTAPASFGSTDTWWQAYAGWTR